MAEEPPLSVEKKGMASYLDINQLAEMDQLDVSFALEKDLLVLMGFDIGDRFIKLG